MSRECAGTRPTIRLNFGATALALAAERRRLRLHAAMRPLAVLGLLACSWSGRLGGLGRHQTPLEQEAAAQGRRSRRTFLAMLAMDVTSSQTCGMASAGFGKRANGLIFGGQACVVGRIVPASRGVRIHARPGHRPC